MQQLTEIHAEANHPFPVMEFLQHFYDPDDMYILLVKGFYVSADSCRIDFNQYTLKFKLQELEESMNLKGFKTVYNPGYNFSLPSITVYKTKDELETWLKKQKPPVSIMDAIDDDFEMAWATTFHDPDGDALTLTLTTNEPEKSACSRTPFGLFAATKDKTSPDPYSPWALTIYKK